MLRAVLERAFEEQVFEPDISRAKKSDHKFYLERASVLRKLLVYRSPVMPMEWSRFHCSLRELDCSSARYAAGLRMPSAEWGARVL